MRKMRILFIVPYPSEGASNRLRVEQYLPYLETKGIRYRIRPFVNKNFYRILYIKGHYFSKVFYFFISILNRFFDIFRALKYDIIFIHREALPVGSALIETILSKFGKKIIFDFDDAVFLPNTSKSNNYIERFKNPNKISRIITLSDCVIVGNNYLAEYADKFNNNVIVIPTPIDTNKYTVDTSRRNSSEVTIGWIGSFTTRTYLEEIRHILELLKMKYPNMKLKFIGNWSGLKNPFDKAEYKEWSLEREISDIRSFDIGIMPMPNDMWTKGKCGFKAILYMACGIPVVASPVGTNTEIIEDGVNGFFADSEKGWINRLSILIENLKLRKRIGMAGRKSIEDHYSVISTVSRFIQVINTVYTAKKKR